MNDHSSIFMNPETTQEDLYAYDKMRSYGADMPDPRTMFGSSSQHLFPTRNDFGPGASFRSANYATQDYGISDTVKHEMFGQHRALGVSARDTKFAKDEYRALWATSAAGEAGSIASGAVAGALVGTAIGGPFGTAVGMGVGAIAGISGNDITKNFMDGYRRTQKAGVLTSGILNADGSMGFSGKDNAELGKFMQDESDFDMHMNESDYQEMAKKMKQGGGLQGKKNLSEIKSGIKGMVADVKELSQLFGEDMGELTDAMLGLVRKGMTQKGAKGLMSSMRTAAAVSGVDMSVIESMSESAFNAAKTTDSVDARHAQNKAVESALEYKSLVGTGLLKGSLKQGDSYISASISAEQKTEAYAHERGTSTNQMIMMADIASEKSGKTFKEEFNRIENLSSGDLIDQYGKMDSKQLAISQSRSSLSSYITNNISDEKIESIKGSTNSSSEYKRLVKNLGTTAYADSALSKRGYSGDEISVMRTTHISRELGSGRVGNKSTGQIAAEKDLASRKQAEDLKAYKENSSLYEGTSRLGRQTGSWVNNNLLGGLFGSGMASNQQDKVKDSIFGTGDKSSSGSFSGISTKNLGRLLVQNKSPETKIDKTKKEAIDQYLKTETVNYAYGGAEMKEMGNRGFRRTGGGVSGTDLIKYGRSETKDKQSDFSTSTIGISKLGKKEYNKFSAIKDKLISKMGDSYNEEEFGKNVSAQAYHLSTSKTTKEADLKYGAEALATGASAKEYESVKKNLSKTETEKLKVDNEDYSKKEMKNLRTIRESIVDTADAKFWGNAEDSAEDLMKQEVTTSDMTKSRGNMGFKEGSSEMLAFDATFAEMQALEYSNEKKLFKGKINTKDGNELLEDSELGDFLGAMENIDYGKMSGEEVESYQAKIYEVMTSETNKEKRLEKIEQIGRDSGLSQESLKTMDGAASRVEFGFFDSKSNKEEAIDTYNIEKGKVTEDFRKNIATSLGMEQGGKRHTSFMKSMEDGTMGEWLKNDKGGRNGKSLNWIGEKDMDKVLNNLHSTGTATEGLAGKMAAGVDPGSLEIVKELATTNGLLKQIRDDEDGTQLKDG